MPRFSALRARLVSRLQTLMGETRAQGRTRLPSIRTLAAEHRVAYETMWKAVDQCRRQGLVTVSQGGALHIAEHAAPPPVNHQPAAIVDSSFGPKWQQVRERLLRELAEGRFAHERKLPSLKLLGVRFGASYPVIRKALASLCQEQTIEPCKGGYAPCRPPTQSAGGVVVLYTGAVQPNRQMSRFFSRNWDVLRSLEQACISAGLRLETVPLLDGRPAQEQGLAPTPERDVRGYVFWVQNVGSSRAPDLAEELAARGKPLAVLDEAAVAVYRCARTPQSLVRLYSLGVGSLCGAAIGRHLAGLGHLRVAYFSTLAAREDRGEGLRRGLTESGGLGNVTVFHALPREWQGRHHDEFALTAHQAAPAESREVWRQVLAEVQPSINTALFGIAHSEALAPAFEQALADPAITAWVGCNDPTALACLRFLAERGVAVPRRISVAGFDDSLEAVANGLTSYNFNVTGLAHAMVTHLLRPAMKRERRGGSEWFEPAGLVTRRASSGPVASPRSIPKPQTLT
jgi:DNA-binding LacI/PurR family transcriptional regulator/DNA-binding transcriptional regulator YhcF (GntR family)